MEPKDRNEAIKLLATLALMYDKRLEQSVIELYLNALRDLALDDLRRACDQASRECKFFPKPVELRELVQDSVSERAEKAWTLFVEACHQSGDRSLYCDDNVLVRTMNAIFGGWIQAYELIVYLSPEMMTAKRKEFVSCYRREEKHPTNEELRFSAGRQELMNRESRANWAKRWLEEGRTEYSIEYVTIRDRVGRAFCTCDVATGLLTGRSRKQLMTGTEQRELPPAVVPKMIAESSGPPMTPDEIKAGIAALTRRIQ